MDNGLSQAKCLTGVSTAMSSTTQQLLDAALSLSEGERIEFVEALLVSLQPDDRPPFDESWREVVRRRSTELRSGQVVPIPWSEVKRGGRQHVDD